jgi:hypothetical protein
MTYRKGKERRDSSSKSEDRERQIIHAFLSNFKNGFIILRYLEAESPRKEAGNNGTTVEGVFLLQKKKHYSKGGLESGR